MQTAERQREQRSFEERLELSPNGLKTWAHCRARFRYEYAEGLRVWENSERSAEGSIMHACCEAILLQRCPRDADAVFAWARTYRDSVSWDKPVSDTKVSSAALKARIAVASLERYFPGYHIETVEESYASPHPEDPTIVLTGRSDLVLLVPPLGDACPLGGRLAKGGRLVLDWKGISRKPSEESLAYFKRASGPQRYDHDLQGVHYSCALELAGRPVAATCLLRVEGPGHSATTRLVDTTSSARAKSLHLEGLVEIASDIRKPPRASDRTHGDCFVFGQICKFHRMCAADRDAEPLLADLGSLSLQLLKRH